MHGYNLPISNRVRAVFFDVGSTLLFVDWPHILRPLRERKLAPSPDQLLAIERNTKTEFDAIMQQRSAVDLGFWHMFYSRLFAELDLRDNQLRDSLVEATRISANWCVVRPGTREILQRLGRDYQLGVISNADGQIAAVLERCGIADCLTTITDSGLVGHEKPHPAIFEAALRNMGSTAGQSLYVGDIYSVDYLGATRSGMQAILFDVAGTYRDTELPRVESLEELERKLYAADPS
jgi:putative hydrolase of the HAD superfamily